LLFCFLIAYNASADHPCEITVSPPLQVVQTTVAQTNYAEYFCVPGYQLVGNSKRYCGENAVLSGDQPICELIYCPNLSATSVLSVTMSDLTYVSNGVATYTCAAGYSMLGSNTRTCQADGTWSGSEPTCSINTCPLPSATNPLAVSAPDITYKSDATYVCDIGYSMTGSNTRTCQADGTWSGSEPTCSIVTCPLPSATSPLAVSAPDITYKSDATYFCDIGYSMTGSNPRTCQADGTWSGSEPTCSIVTCPLLFATSPLSVSAQNLTYNSNVAYSCATGFEINGTNSRTWQNDGTWSDLEPSCTPVTCPIMSAPKNGQVTFPSGFVVGGKAEFECNQGYILSDNRSPTCTVAGTWDLSRPSCLYIGKILNNITKQLDAW